MNLGPKLYLLKYKFAGDTWMGRGRLILASKWVDAQTSADNYLHGLKQVEIVEASLRVLTPEEIDNVYAIPHLEVAK